MEHTPASSTTPINLKTRIVRIPPRLCAYSAPPAHEAEKHCLEGDGESWRELLKYEVQHHSFALLSFEPQGNGHKTKKSQKQKKGKHSGEENEAKLTGLLEDHQQRVRPQFFAQSQDFKRRLDPGRMTKQLGDTGYCLRENIKEQLQVRLGPHMPWPSSPHAAPAQVDKGKGKGGGGECDAEDDDDVAKYGLMQGELEDLFAMLDGVARKCASALVGDGARTRLHGALDPSPADLFEGAGSGEYTSSSVMTLTHYFNTEQGPDEPCRSHADTGLVTLAMDPTAGLQLFDPCGAKWFDCAHLGPLEQAQGMRVDAVLMVGEALHRLTQGGLAVTSHRVVNTNQARSSTVFKLRPRPDFVGPRTEADYALLLLQQPVVSRMKQREVEMEAAWKETGFDVLVHVFSFLSDTRDVGRCALVCRAWREAADSHVLWRSIVAKLGEDVVGLKPPREEGGSEREEVDYKKLYVAYVRELRNSAAGLKDMLAVQDHYLKLRLRSTTVPLHNIKMVNVGSNGVGKTSLLIRYTTDSFPEDYIPTVFDEYVANIRIDDVTVTVGLWDTAGHPEYDRLRPLSYPATDCFLLCFAVNDRASFKEARDKFIPELRQHCPLASIVLVGTKSDLRATDPSADLVSTSEAMALVKTLGLQMYAECSAKTGDNVTETCTVGIKIPLLKAAGLLHAKSEKKAGKCTLQ